MRQVLKGCVSWFVVLAFVGLCIGPFLFLSIYLDVRGVVADGTVVGKDEYIAQKDDEPRWNRRLQIQVSFEPVGQSWPETTMISVDAATYDLLHVGSTVRVRHLVRDAPGLLSVLPIARLEHQSTVSVVTTQPLFIQLAVMLALGEGVLIWIWSMVRFKPARRVLLAILGVNAIAIAVLFSRPGILRGDQGPIETATATVRTVERITIASRSQRGSDTELLRPYDRVELAFDPVGEVDPVIALDEIDPGSVPELVVGGQVEVTYARDNPRVAHIAGAGYSHRRLNWLSFPAAIGIMIITAVVILAGVFFLGSVLKRLLARRAAGQLRSP